MTFIYVREVIKTQILPDFKFAAEVVTVKEKSMVLPNGRMGEYQMVTHSEQAEIQANLCLKHKRETYFLIL